MAIYEVQHIFHHSSGLPEDDVVNTLHFADGDGADIGTAEDIAGFVAACFYDAQDPDDLNYLEEFISPQISRTPTPTIKVYDAEEPGPPLAVADALAMRAILSGSTAIPTEVALVGSFRANLGLPEEVPDTEDPGFAVNRPASSARNRIYVGPVGSAGVNGATARPIGSFQKAILNLFTLLKDTPTALINADCAWVVYSRKHGTTYTPTDAWVDNAFDTQRRRGVAPTDRSTVLL